MSIKNNCLIWAVIILSTIITQPVLAAPQQDYDAGVQSFRAGNYAKALDYFQRAEAEGMPSDQLKYNLGSVYYKLQDYDNSRRYFESLTDRDNYRSLAYYNLGLIENKQGNRQAAIDYFEKCVQSSANEKLQQLAQKQINTLSQKSDSEPSSWFAYISLSYGEDSNIGQTASGEASELPSSYLEALGVLGGSPWRKGDHSVHTVLSYYSRDYSGDGQYDNDLVHLTADYRQQLDNWEMMYGLRFIESNYASDDFLQQSGLSLKAKTRLSERSDLKIGLIHEDITSLTPVYSYLDGYRTKLNIGYELKKRHDEYRYQFELEDNDRTDTPTQSHSPTRSKIDFKYIRTFTEKWRAGGDLQYRVSDYDTVASQDRKDKRIRSSLIGEYTLGKLWKLNLKLQYTDNDSSEAQFNYHKYLYSIGLSALFQ